MSTHFVIQVNIKKVERADSTTAGPGRSVVTEGSERIIDEVTNVVVRADTLDQGIAKAKAILDVG